MGKRQPGRWAKHRASPRSVAKFHQQFTPEIARKTIQVLRVQARNRIKYGLDEPMMPIDRWGMHLKGCPGSVQAAMRRFKKRKEERGIFYASDDPCFVAPEWPGTLAAAQTAFRSPRTEGHDS